MDIKVSLFIYCFYCTTFATSQVNISRLNLYEGDICNRDGYGKIWTCKHVDDCAGLREKIKNGGKPTVCISKEAGKHVVCCEPQGKESTSVGSRAREMCKVYGELVYTYRRAPIGDGKVQINNCKTGVTPLIIGGKNADPGEYPHMALIGHGEEDSISWVCGGSLISDRYVISAAHCSYSRGRNAMWVRLGEHNINSTYDEKNGQSSSKDYKIVKIIDYPTYNRNNFYNDITLYKLNTSVTFNEFVRPICLETRHEIENTFATATGWGHTDWENRRRSDILQKVNLTMTSKKVCSDSYARITNINRSLRNGINYETQMCAGDHQSNKDTCQGDSGGPLQIVNKKPYCTYNLVGITSFGSKKCKERPGVYTKVSHFVPWIESIVWPIV